MISIKRSRDIYTNLGYWFILFIVLAFLGFYKTYFSIIFEPHPVVVHFHFVFMMIWMGMAIVQPFLIKYKKLELHRLVGKISYGIVPLVIFTAFLMSKHSYFAFKAGLLAQETAGKLVYSEAEVLQMTAKEMGLAVFYTLWLAIFYILAIYHKRDRIPHSRYMLAAVLTFMGPTVDRIFFFGFNKIYLFGNITVEYISYFLINIILIGFIYLDRGNPKGQKALGISLGIYLLGQILYATARNSMIWERIVTAVYG